MKRSSSLQNHSHIGKNKTQNRKVMQRIPYFDFLRGIAIIMVVCLHCIDFSAMEGAVLNFFGVEFRNLLNAAVPLFLAISGYFMANKKWIPRRHIEAS